MTDANEKLATAVLAICDPSMSTNPVAWFQLHEAGITREIMQAQVANGKWSGPPPVFDNAPAYDSEMWLFLLSQSSITA